MVERDELSAGRVLLAFMRPAIALAVTLLMLVPNNVMAQTEAEDSWSRWRGPKGNGIAAATNLVPLKWSDTENVVWKVAVPGRGHSSPIVHEGRIYLTTADKIEQTQSVLCFNQQDGAPLWSQICNTGGLPDRIHDKNTHASPTVAIVGEHVVAVFNHHDAIHATCFDLDGQQVWQHKVGPYAGNFPFGYGTSPIAFSDLVIVTNENKIQSEIVAYVAATGKEKWRIPRKLPAGYETNDGLQTSYSTPVVADIGGRIQMLLSGGNRVTSYDPQTGRELWKSPASWDVSCGTMVWDEYSNSVFASGGYPTQETLAIKADGSGEKVWSKSVKCYEQSLIVVDGYLYGQSDRGVIYCWNAADGTVQWKERFEGPESASPVAVGDFIFFTSEKGKTLVIKANAEKFEMVATNRLGDESFPSFAICSDRIYARVADGSSGKRQEFLYCLGKPQ